MAEARRFPYKEIDRSAGTASSLPYIPLTLTYQDTSLSTEGLLDTGSAVNVLPYDVGLELGAVWERQIVPVTLTGTLSQLEARVLIVSSTVGKFVPIRLALAWTQANTIPLILGQVNFFLEFDVCFYRSMSFVEIRPKHNP